MNGGWVPHDTRDQLVDFVNHWSDRAEIPAKCFIAWLEVAKSTFHTWKERYGRANEHNAKVPRDHWLEPHEKEAIVRFHEQYPLEGYRRLTFMMIDRDVVAASPATVYRVLKAAGRLDRRAWAPSQKGRGFEQPTKPHEHWHVDISHINLGGTFYYLCAILDGYSRSIVHWELREQMKERDVETIVQRARERHPAEHPRIISDNGPQFIAKDFKAFVRLAGLTHVKTSPYYPQSNGKIERWHASLKHECIRPAAPASLSEARRLVGRYVEHYNTVRLHSALGYVAPADKLAGREPEIHAERDRKLEAARGRRAESRRAAREVA